MRLICKALAISWLAVAAASLAAQPRAVCGPGRTFQPPSCENMRGQQIPTLAGIVAHVVAIDEENGTVLLWMDFGPGSRRTRSGWR